MADTPEDKAAKQRAYMQEYRRTHKTTRPPGYKEERARKAREQYAADPEYREKAKAAAKAYRQANPEKVAETQKNWGLKNLEGRRRGPRKWARENRGKMAQIVAAWRAAHPEARTRYAASRRAKLLGLEEHVSDAELARLMVWQQGRCFCCGSRLGPRNKTMDHIVPLNRGGTNRLLNCRWACRRCNFSRQDRWLGIEWKPESEDWTGMHLECRSSLKDALEVLAPQNPHLKEIQTSLGPAQIIELGTTAFTILSSFMWSASGASLMQLRDQNPELLLFWDWEWASRRLAIWNSILVKSGAGHRVHARDCEVAELDWDISKPFLERYHIQGAIPASRYMGLMHRGNPVAILTTTGPLISRFCTGVSVPGALARLLAHLPLDGHLETFCEPRYATGAGYLKAGFEALPPATQPSYGYMQGPFYLPRTAMQSATRHTAVEVDVSEMPEADCAAINGLLRLEGLPQLKFQWVRGG